MRVYHPTGGHLHYRSTHVILSLSVVKVDGRDGHSRGSNPEPRLISQAIIAAFHNDNNMRVKLLGTYLLTSKVVPGIVMGGDMPSFTRIVPKYRGQRRV